MILTDQNTAVVIDSTADFPEAEARFPNFRVVPLYVRFGEESYRDCVDMSPTAFYERLPGAKEMPTTSQPTPADFHAVYSELAPQYERILSIQISSTLSGTFASAGVAAELLGGDIVRVIDSVTVSGALAMLAIANAQTEPASSETPQLQELVRLNLSEPRMFPHVYYGLRTTD